MLTRPSPVSQLPSSVVSSTPAAKDQLSTQLHEWPAMPTCSTSSYTVTSGGCAITIQPSCNLLLLSPSVIECKLRSAASQQAHLESRAWPR